MKKSAIAMLTASLLFAGSAMAAEPAGSEASTTSFGGLGTAGMVGVGVAAAAAVAVAVDNNNNDTDDNTGTGGTGTSGTGGTGTGGTGTTGTN
ncbi:hypothetical protein L9G74_12310 [Shewanella sp. C32]|uniref:Exopolysaccharide production protein YjbE n=1 Tax=Shewanella electrica TaxID=515560 RepID=A0ABT2FLS6_9GAMM|nr:hypothetical protein [Shewanella electrica]MCH1925887.1 hypothetical protein [Shewanella electrica]MCS4557228.1 hypothetical protein [Shewanella electrica]